MKQQWIMIAGPYTSGARSQKERAGNHRELNTAAYEIFKKGHIPIIGVNLALPIIDAVGQECFDELMMPISLAADERCDAVLRIPGHSEGADEEVARIRESGGDVYESLDEIQTVTAV